MGEDRAICLATNRILLKLRLLQQAASVTPHEQKTRRFSARLLFLVWFEKRQRLSNWDRTLRSPSGVILYGPLFRDAIRRLYLSLRNSRREQPPQYQPSRVIVSCLVMRPASFFSTRIQPPCASRCKTRCSAFDMSIDVFENLNLNARIRSLQQIACRAVLHDPTVFSRGLPGLL